MFLAVQNGQTRRRNKKLAVMEREEITAHILRQSLRGGFSPGFQSQLTIQHAILKEYTGTLKGNCAQILKFIHVIPMVSPKNISKHEQLSLKSKTRVLKLKLVVSPSIKS